MCGGGRLVESPTGWVSPWCLDRETTLVRSLTEPTGRKIGGGRYRRYHFVNLARTGLATRWSPLSHAGRL